MRYYLTDRALFCHHCFHSFKNVPYISTYSVFNCYIFIYWFKKFYYIFNFVISYCLLIFVFLSFFPPPYTLLRSVGLLYSSFVFVLEILIILSLTMPIIFCFTFLINQSYQGFLVSVFSFL